MSTYGTPYIYSPTCPTEHDWRSLPEGNACECQDCEWRGHIDDCKPIKHLHERVAPGEPMPAGECPECGALASIRET